MTKRERELAQRHLSELEDMRDYRWNKAVDSKSGTSFHLARHEALAWAIKTLRAELDKPETVAAAA